MGNNTIVVVGSSNTDMIIKVPRIPRPGETVLGGQFSMAAGGKGANQAVAAARAGGKVLLIARVGEDLFGEEAVQSFERDTIDVHCITRDDQAPSGIALIFVGEGGENSIAVAPGANANLTPAHVDRFSRQISEAGTLLTQLETPLETVLRATEVAAASGKRIILNPAPARPVPVELLRRVRPAALTEHSSIGLVMSSDMSSPRNRNETNSSFPPADCFERRHIGPGPQDIAHMLDVLGFPDLDSFIDRVVPPAIRAARPLEIGESRSEHQALADFSGIASRNRIYRSFIGMGYYDCITPAVIQRNILENPGWYTQYTPYQPEIAQGRLEALLNFQTMIADLTGLQVANASLLDEATAAAEAMNMSRSVARADSDDFFVSTGCFPQTIEVVKTRAWAQGIRVICGDHREFDFSTPVFGALVQYPAVDGEIHDYADFAGRARSAGAIVTVAADLLGLTLLKPPGEFGADIAIGSTQRFGIPLGYGGPHAGYFATRDEFKRQMPG
ncbi:MAG: glycine dehydrogenase, decarboxylating, partial [Acidobacteria bacterium]|nr:glycine dehydrogenase, decarboxylating [Acidobacteriota bacterium]